MFGVPIDESVERRESNRSSASLDPSRSRILQNSDAASWISSRGVPVDGWRKICGPVSLSLRCSSVRLFPCVFVFVFCVRVCVGWEFCVCFVFPCGGDMEAKGVLSHAQRVTRLYRNSLRHLLSWTVDRELFIQEALPLRAEFRKHAIEKDPARAAVLLKRGEEKFLDMVHPDVYKVPTSVGGSKYMRNPHPFSEIVKNHS